VADYVGRVAHAHNVDRQPNRLGHPGEIQLCVDSLHFDMEGISGDVLGSRHGAIVNLIGSIFE
jgi:hypothetical protein